MTNVQDEVARARTKRWPLGQVIERLLSGNCFLIIAVEDSLSNVNNSRRNSRQHASADRKNWVRNRRMCVVGDQGSAGSWLFLNLSMSTGGKHRMHWSSA